MKFSVLLPAVAKESSPMYEMKPERTRRGHRAAKRVITSLDRCTGIGGKKRGSRRHPEGDKLIGKGKEAKSS